MGNRRHLPSVAFVCISKFCCSMQKNDHVVRFFAQNTIFVWAIWLSFANQMQLDATALCKH